MNPAARLPRDSVERFRADLARLAPTAERLAVAVSGGPDSLALLLLAAAALPGRVMAATVNHRLRPESAAEAGAVARLCSALGCPHGILTVDVPAGREGLQAGARRTRYAALVRWAGESDAGALATAHHQDDQAETMLMRLMRGSGVAGLAGIRPLRRDLGVPLVRPLLGWSKAELAELVAAAGVAAADDPSNRDRRFDRTRARRLLARHPELSPPRLARSADALRQADEALAWMTEALLAERAAAAEDCWIIDPQGLPRELRRRLLEAVIAEMRQAAGLPPIQPRGLDELLGALDAGGAGTLAGVAARCDGLRWRLRPAPPRR